MNGRASGQVNGTPGTQTTMEQSELQSIAKSNERSVQAIQNIYSSKQAAVTGTSSYPPPIAKSAKSFFKGGSNAYKNFTISRQSDGSYHFTMEKPGNVPGSKAIYHKLVSSDGETVRVYKDTFDPQGNLVHRKEK